MNDKGACVGVRQIMGLTQFVACLIVSSKGKSGSLAVLRGKDKVTMPLPLYSGSEGLSLVELTRLTAMAAGAVTGAAAGWLCKRSAWYSLIAFMIGIMGGLLIGTGMGRLLYVAKNGMDCYITAGLGCLCSAALSALAGSIPTALVISVVITFLTLRHMHPRPPRVRTGLLAMFCGVVGGFLTAVFVALV